MLSQPTALQAVESLHIHQKSTQVQAALKITSAIPEPIVQF